MTGVLPQLAINAAVLLIAGSWLYLALLRIARAFTGWPKIRGVTRRITQVAVFFVVLSACLFAWVVVSFIVVMPSFFSDIPPDKQAVIDVVGLGALGVGLLLGTLAALRVGSRWWVEDPPA